MTEKASGLFADDLFTPHDFLLSLFEIIVCNRLQVVDVVEENIFHEIDFRFDVTRNGYIDEQQRAVSAKFH